MCDCGLGQCEEEGQHLVAFDTPQLVMVGVCVCVCVCVHVCVCVCVHVCMKGEVVGK